MATSERLSGLLARLRSACAERESDLRDLDELASEVARLVESCAKAEERFRRLELVLPGAVFCYRLTPEDQAGFTYASSGVRAMFDAAPEDVVRDTSLISGRIHPEDRERRDQGIRRMIEQGALFHEELRHIVNGEVRWCECISHVHSEPDGTLTGHGVLLDIGDRKRAERERQVSEARYRRLLETMRDGFVVTDFEGRILESNRAYQEMLGYSAGELTGLRVADLTAGSWLAAASRTLEQIVARGYSDVYEKEYQRKDGSLVPVECRTSAVLDKDGHPSVLWAVVRDISERKHAAESQKRIEARLAEAERMEAVGRLAGGVAHDFNNMLTVILGYTELAQSDGSISSATENALREIGKAAAHSRDITGQLLAFSRRQIVEKKVLDLNQLIAERRATLARLIGEDVELCFLPGALSRRVEVDSAQIAQILMNLAGNARDAMPQGGKLTIETEDISISPELGAAHPELIPPGDYVRMSVTDTGQGMDRDTLAHCFEPFFTTKATGRGTGLGLATVYGAIKQNGGFISAYSEPAVGTAFHVYLPAVVDSAEAVPVTEVPDARGAATVLLVEDEEMVRRLTAGMLVRLGYAVMEAASPDAALKLYREGQRADVLLTDVVMPEKGGAQLRDEIRRLQPGIRVVFMSGFTSETALRRGASGDGFLQKPFSLGQLGRVLHAALDEKGFGTTPG